MKQHSGEACREKILSALTVTTMNEQRQLHLLVVDDDNDFLELIARELSETHGHQTTVARNGQETIALLERGTGRYDIILLDYSMKGMNGLDVLRWIQQHDIETPVIILTGIGSEEIAVQAMKLGAYDYVRKENLDLQHLEVLVQATYERHLFRVTKAMEEETLREAGLGLETTEQLRDVVKAISQSVDTSFASIAEELQKAEEQVKHIPDRQRSSALNVFNELRRKMGVLESGLHGFVKLYTLVHAHHAWNEELQQIKREFFEAVKQQKVEKGRPPAAR